MVLQGYTSFRFTHDGESKTVYRRGAGPGVVIIHEVPGITPPVERFANYVVEAGFTAFLPHLFGTPGKTAWWLCARADGARGHLREFQVLAAGGSSPVTDWLRALCRHAHANAAGPGRRDRMCLTGNFALSLMVDESVWRPCCHSPRCRSPSPGATARVSTCRGRSRDREKRARAGCSVLGMRSPPTRWFQRKRFARLRRELGDGFEAIEIDSAAPTRTGSREPRTRVTNDLVDEAGHPTRAALERVLGFFTERLRPAARGERLTNYETSRSRAKAT